MKYKKFNKYFPIMELELKKREHLWQLKGIPSIDFDDFTQCLLTHISLKIGQFDETRDFTRWFSAVFRNFFANFLRNRYGRFAKICSRCPLYESPNYCRYTDSEPCNKCIFYKKWMSSHKSSAHQIELPVTLENHQEAAYSIPGDAPINYDVSKKNLEKELKKVLTKFHWKVYNLLFIKELPERQVVKILGFKREVGRDSVKQTRDAVALIKQEAKKLLDKGIADIL